MRADPRGDRARPMGRGSMERWISGRHRISAFRPCAQPPAFYETQRRLEMSTEAQASMNRHAIGDMPGGTRDPRRWWALALLCGAFFMVILDAAIVTVALPSIQEDLSFSAQGLQWVVSAYALTFAGLLL